MNDVTIEGVGFSPLVLNNTKQKLSLISSNTYLRTVNGELIVLGDTVKKHRLVIWGQDLHSPAFGDLLKGKEVRVHSSQRLFQQILKTPLELEHKAVPKSILVMGPKKESLPFEQIDEKTIAVHESLTGGNYCVSYFPIFSMKILDLSYETSQDTFKFNWELTLEEI